MKPQLAAGLLLLAVLVALAAGGPWFAADPLAVDMERVLRPPGPGHLLGTDGLGRDVLARTLAGGRASLAAGLVATLVAAALGVGLGTASGLAGSATDLALARAADTINAFPPLVGALALGAVAGAGGELRTGAIVGVFAWPALYRFVRAEVLALRRAPVAEAARAVGAGRWRLGLRHLLPLAVAPALVPATFVAGGAILVEATLGFLGLGIRPPRPSWGNLLAEGMTSAGSAWWLTVFPGLAIFAAVLALYLVGEGLRD